MTTRPLVGMILVAIAVALATVATAQPDPKRPGTAQLTGTVGKARFSPRLRMPPAKTVREVGGVQYGRHVDLKLRDGTTVRCYPAATENLEINSKNWYYLPTNPRVARHPDGTPVFSMIRFVTDKSREEGGVDGAILHFMVEYGLTPEQQAETARLLEAEEPGARLKGAVQLEATAEGNGFQVISATLGDEGFTSTLVTSGKAPVVEGQRVAVAARLDGPGATLLAASLENPTTDLTVAFDLKYIVKLPAYDVEVVIDFERYHSIQETSTESRDREVTYKQYRNPKWWNRWHRTTRTEVWLNETDQQEIIDSLSEEGVITFNYRQDVPDADEEIVESGLHKLVLESFFDLQTRMGTPSEEEAPAEEDDEAELERTEARQEEIAKSRQHRYTVFRAREITKSSKQTLSLKKSIARYEEHHMEGNIGAWYADFKDDPRLVSEVNLDDPFFQRREVRFVIDNEAYDIFKDMVNYATVKVQVPREGQRPYEGELTIDRKHLEQQGQTASLSFARMGDDAQEYEYATQWSLRGGYLYPSEPRWQTGELMAVTLAAPVRPVLIEAEADLDELENLGVARVTVELRYRRFGKSYLDREGLALSPAQGEPVVSKIVYRDTESDVLEYRRVFHHREIAPIADSEWRRLEGTYVYCAPPAELLERAQADDEEVSRR